MPSVAELELVQRGCPGAARVLVDLFPADTAKGRAEAVAAWDPLYLPFSSFDVNRRIDARKADSTTLLGSGTFCDVHADLACPEHVIMLARYSFSGATTYDDADGATYLHYTTTITSALKIREVSMPDREPKWAAVPHAFTLLVDEDDKVWFVFFMKRYTPLDMHPIYLRRNTEPKMFQRLVWSLVVSAWFTENVAGLAHRDIKPDNILVTPDGRAVLADFGSACKLGCSGNPSHYMNPPWMAPAELEAINEMRPYTWLAGGSTFAVGLLILWLCWGEKRFRFMFPQQRQKRWIRTVITDRRRMYYTKYRSLLTKTEEIAGAGLQTAGLMLANPDSGARSTLMYIERVIRPKTPAAFLELPPGLQRSEDIAI